MVAEYTEGREASSPRAWERASGTDTLEQDGRGFVVGILRDECAFEGFLEDGLTQAVCAGGGGVDLAGQVGY